MQALLLSLLEKGIKQQCYCASAACVGVKDRVLATACAGQTMRDGQTVTTKTRFDMASMTKIMSTTMLALLALENGDITLDDAIARYLPAPDDKRDITIGELMTHTSGIMPSIQMQKVIADPAEFVPRVLEMPLLDTRGTPEYSCFGFILLGKIMELVYAAPLDKAAQTHVFTPLHMLRTTYNPVGGDFAATELDPDTGKPIIGVVHDENARFLGGVSGNAGVFSDIEDCARYAQMLAQKGAGFLSPATMKKAIHNYTPGFDVHRGLGFHLGGTPANFMGDLMPACSFGHTGFTGTSIAVDPETGFYFVLLTNRVYPTRENMAHMRFRRAIHNRLYTAFIKGE